MISVDRIAWIFHRDGQHALLDRHPTPTLLDVDGHDILVRDRRRRGTEPDRAERAAEFEVRSPPAAAGNDRADPRSNP